MPVALFRCDGDGVLGHLNRCLALAEALQHDGWICIFLGNYSQVARGLLRAAGFEGASLGLAAGSDADASATQEKTQVLRASLLVLDSYAFTPAFAARLKSPSTRLAMIDDFAAWHTYPVDVVLNFTISAPRRDYPVGDARLLLGPTYFPARKAVRDLARQPRRVAEEPFRICVALSGDINGDAAATALEALQSPAFEARVVISPMAGNRGQVEAAIGAKGAASAVRIAPTDLAIDLAWADVVLCTGGLIKYEAIFLGAYPLTFSNNAGESEDTLEWSKHGVGEYLGPMAGLSSNRVAAAVAKAVAQGPQHLYASSQRGRAFFSADPAVAAARGLIAHLEQPQ